MPSSLSGTLSTHIPWDSYSSINLNSRYGPIDLIEVAETITSLLKRVKELEERMHMLEFNYDMEKEWQDLKNLGEQYRKLEAELILKQQMWNTLKK